MGTPVGYHALPWPGVLSGNPAKFEPIICRPQYVQCTLHRRTGKPKARELFLCLLDRTLYLSDGGVGPLYDEGLAPSKNVSV